MPWQHCTHLEISDDRNCPTCGLSKQEWTVKVQVTRVLRLGGQPTVKIELKDDAGAYQAGVKYRIELPDGMIALGELNPAGYAKASSKIPGDAVVSFPDLGAGVTAVTDRARPGDEAGAFLCPTHKEKYEFKLGTWIELELTEPRHGSFPNEPYELTDSAGKLFTGTLDERSVARVTGLAPGACRVRFPLRDQRLADGLGWLEIAARDDDGRALADEPYEVVLPDGALRTGQLDANGRARLEEVPHGACRVRFPLRDQREAPGERLHWVDFVATDDDGLVLADEPYELLTPDGQTITGATDQNGHARHEGLAAGSCTVRFPRRDRRLDSGLVPVPVWLEFEAVDAAGQPLADEPYEVLAADGQTLAGTTDERGHARHEGLAAGGCTVRFPRRDGRQRGGVAPAWLAFEALDEAGQPLANEPYEVLTPDGGTLAGTTDERGCARHEELAAGSCTVRFPRRDGRESDGAVDAPVWLELEAVDEAGQPLANEPYEVLTPDGGTLAGTTDERGCARHEGLAAGSCTVRFPRRDGRESDGAVDAPVWLELEAVDEAGQPLADEPYEVVTPDGQTLAGTTDERGCARHEGLAAGSCTVRFPRRDGRESDGAVDAPVWLELEAVDEAGQPLADEPYEVVTPDGQTLAGTTDERGCARHEGLAAGSCTVRFPARDGREAVGSLAERPTWLEFEARDEAGEPLADEPYELVGPDGATLAGKTDAKGRARHEGLPRGAFAVRFPARDGRAVA